MFQSQESRFNRWVKDHYAFLFRAAWALIGSRSEAEELVQDTFGLAWRHFDQLRKQEMPRAWLYRILRHECLRHIQARTDTVSWDVAYDNLLYLNEDVERRLELMQALQRLTPIHREILVLYYLQDVSYDEVAVALEIAPGTVMSRLSRARNELRQLMGDDNVDAQRKLKR